MDKNKHGGMGSNKSTSQGDTSHKGPWKTEPNAARGPGDTYDSPKHPPSPYEPANTTIGK